MNFRFFNHRLFSALLNFIGLTLAFSAFLVIMVQVVYDYGYDRNYEDAERIFRDEVGFAGDRGRRLLQLLERVECGGVTCR